MNVPLITWCFIVAIFVTILVVRVVSYLTHDHPHAAHRHHLLEIGSEREEFFVPGDPLRSRREPPYASKSMPDYDDDIV